MFLALSVYIPGLLVLVYDPQNHRIPPGFLHIAGRHIIYIVGNVSSNTTRTDTFGHCFFSLSAVIAQKRQFVIHSYSQYIYFRSAVKCNEVNKQAVSKAQFP